MRVNVAVKTFIAFSLLPCVFLLTVLWLVPVSPDLHADRWAKAMRGFSNMWAAGHFILQGKMELLFDRSLYNVAIKELFGPNFTEQMWGYPPVMGLIVVPFALLPLGLAFAIWTVSGLACLYFALKKVGFTNGFITAIFLSPALWESCLSGQTGAFTGAILVLGLMLSTDRAGLVLSLMIFKPQLAFMFPIKLLAEKAWRTIMGLVAGTVLLLSASILWFGCDTWILFLTKTSRFMSDVIMAPWTGAPAQANFSSVFISARSIGLSNNIAWLEQGVVSLMCCFICWRTWKNIENNQYTKPLKLAITLILTLLATPYAHDYDLVISAIAVAILFNASKERIRGENIAMAIAWISPGLMIVWPLVFNQLAFMSPLVSVLSNIGVLFYCSKRIHDKNASPKETLMS